MATGSRRFLLAELVRTEQHLLAVLRGETSAWREEEDAHGSPLGPGRGGDARVVGDPPDVRPAQSARSRLPVRARTAPRQEPAPYVGPRRGALRGRPPHRRQGLVASPSPHLCVVVSRRRLVERAALVVRGDRDGARTLGHPNDSPVRPPGAQHPQRDGPNVTDGLRARGSAPPRSRHAASARSEIPLENWHAREDSNL